MLIKEALKPLRTEGEIMGRDFESFHGLTLIKIIHFKKINSISLYSSPSNSSYVLNDNIGIFIKHSAKRLSPWRFSFLKEHQNEIKKMSEELEKVFVLLVCNDDGVVCLSYRELKLILDGEHDEIEWISASRKKREHYIIKGSDGKLKFRIGPGDFPKKVFL